MREIKFRAWDKEMNIMIKWNDRLDEYLLALRKKQEKDINYDHLSFMQFTGLKDKNGKEIYEGDIVKTYPQKAIIKWIKKRSAFMVEWIGSSEGMKEQFCSLDGFKDNGLEVIGNIYENPELLK